MFYNVFVWRGKATCMIAVIPQTCTTALEVYVNLQIVFQNRLKPINKLNHKDTNCIIKSFIHNPIANDISFVMHLRLSR